MDFLPRFASVSGIVLLMALATLIWINYDYFGARVGNRCDRTLI